MIFLKKEYFVCTQEVFYIFNQIMSNQTFPPALLELKFKSKVQEKTNIQNSLLSHTMQHNCIINHLNLYFWREKLVLKKNWAGLSKYSFTVKISLSKTSWLLDKISDQKVLRELYTKGTPLPTSKLEFIHEKEI